MTDYLAPHAAELVSTKASRIEIDVGLRQFLLSAYNHIVSRLKLIGLVADPRLKACRIASRAHRQVNLLVAPTRLDLTNGDST